MKKVVLVAAAMIGLGIAARTGEVGQSNRALSGSELANFTKTESITIVGTVVDILAPKLNGQTYRVTTADGFEVSVFVSVDARPIPIQFGKKYQFFGQALGPSAIAVTTPESAKRLRVSPEVRSGSGIVHGGFLRKATPMGVVRVPAPDVPDGSYSQLDIVTQGDRAFAQLPDAMEAEDQQ